jgi:hypothetical protein
MRLKRNVFIIGSLLLMGTAMQASDANLLQRTHRFSPCSQWRYDMDSGLYGCTFLSQPIEVNDARDVAAMHRTIDQLSRSLADLERRVQALEVQ